MKLRDCFWLWGHPEGRFNPHIRPDQEYDCDNTREYDYGNTQDSRMTPMEACLYLGIHKTFMIPVRWKVNRRQYNKSFKTLSDVGWECYHALKNPEAIEANIKEAAEFSNITAVVFDDFKQGADGREYEAYPPDNLWKVRERLHHNEVRPMDMWMVLYTKEIGLNPEDDESFMKYIEPFDGVILWTWCESDLHLLPEKFEIFKQMTPNNRRMFGCYLWNFGEKKPATPKAVTWQLDWYREKILAGEAEGVVFHTNTMADLDLEAYDAACEWMELHGDEEIRRNLT